MREDDSLDHFFLGPKSELRRFFKEVVELVVDDYIFWRRNYHPKDPPAISYRSLQTLDAEAYRGRFLQELFELISDLKLDVPFFSPRYMAHMVSEVAMPGMVAYLASMLCNPNNVSLEGSKPGAAAAAVLFNHRMMPLDQDGYGRHLLALCRLAQDFHHRLTRLNATDAPTNPEYRLVPLAPPETNLDDLLAKLANHLETFPGT